MIENTQASAAWEKIGVRHHHGMQVPLLSLWSEKSCGNGEFLDLLPMIDWLAEMGMDVLQLLPLNDSGEDPSPYNALSATALHPIYLSLHALPNIGKLPTFPQVERIEYSKVLEGKEAFLRGYVSQETERITKEEGYRVFISKRPYLVNYAVYKVLRDKGAVHPLSKHERRAFEKEHRGAVSYHLIVQYLCHQQLSMVKKHAEAKEVFLKGDIPILLSPDSADVWANREFFHLEEEAGSPPNRFDPPGQNWRFPLYNWAAMEENHFEWWRMRVQAAADYFHLYRLDHILGFFRIWAIPKGTPPSAGRFVPDDEALIEAQGRKLLETLLSFSTMLPIGEDLGNPPPCVRETMRELGIPGTKIFRRYRNWDTDASYVPYQDYPPLSLSTVSTHDIETVHLWWESFPEEAQAYAAYKGWTYHATLTQEEQQEILYDNHHSGSLFHINLLQEYLALFPELTWDDPQKERINLPGTESPFNWTYRYRSSIERLAAHSPLKKAIQSIIKT